MSSSVRDIINQAMNRSAKNRPDLIATAATELVTAVDRTMGVCFQIAAVVNPVVFTASASVGPTAGIGWARPADALVVLQLLKADGTELVIVPFDDQTAEPSSPSVYEFGGYYRPAAGTVGITLADSLTITYARGLYAHTGPDVILSPDWPETFNGLLVVDLAMYLALKDGRLEELPVLRTEREAWLAQFIAFLQNHNVGERRRWTRFSPDLSTKQFTAMMAGGA